MIKNFNLKIGKTEMTLDIPTTQILHEIHGNDYPALENLEQSIIDAMNNPIASKPLKEIVQAGQKVLLIVSDITRVWLKPAKFLPPIVNYLNECGIPDANINIIIAQGSHRAHTPEEDLLVCGEEIVKRIKIHQHDAYNMDIHKYVGKTTRGTEIYVNNKAFESDHVILTGGIIYHLMAGFGGGRKSLMPGICHDKTIQGNHCLCLHPEIGKGTNPLCQSGKLEGNPMYEDMYEICDMVSPSFLINFVYTAEGDFARVVAGHWHHAWVDGCKTVEDILGIEIEQKADLVIASAGGFPKDINLYQGCKTIDNATAACKDNGTIIFLLDCPDIYEPKVFTDWFRYDDLLEFENAVRENFSIPAFIAYKTKQTAVQYNCIAVTTIPDNFKVFERVGFKPVATLEEAYKLAQKTLPHNFSVTIMTHGANTLPIIKK